jgi:hypothetical protein
MTETASRDLTLSLQEGETYFAQHDVQRVTIEKLRWLLSKATTVLGDRRVGELPTRDRSLADDTLAGCLFETTQALRQVRHRVVWRMIDTKSRKGRSRQPEAPGGR